MPACWFFPAGAAPTSSSDSLAGAGKETVVYVPPGVTMEPELMYKMCGLISGDFKEVRAHLHMHQKILNKGFYKKPADDDE